MKNIRIHGDNIVECERILNLIINEVNPTKVVRSLSSLACEKIFIKFSRNSKDYSMAIELMPGFNKNKHDRWNDNILLELKDKGSFLDETPDAILTEVLDHGECILLAIEFCSALQAGNQAWQRSGRAYSTGRTKIPYIYIVDFVKFELNSSTRERKALRFPNPIVPYSYVAYSNHTTNFIAQAYFKSEEFLRENDGKLKSFPLDIFAEKEVSQFIVAKITDCDTSGLEKVLIDKNMNMVYYLSNHVSGHSIGIEDWKSIYRQPLITEVLPVSFCVSMIFSENPQFLSW